MILGEKIFIKFSLWLTVVIKGLNANAKKTKYINK